MHVKIKLNLALTLKLKSTYIKMLIILHKSQVVPTLRGPPDSRIVVIVCVAGALYRLGAINMQARVCVFIRMWILNDTKGYK